MILVSGANGNLGGSVIRNLLELLDDPGTLAVGTRNPESEFALGLAQRGVSVRALDFLQPESMVQALRGIDRALFISTYEPNEIRIRQHRNAVSAALDAGVRHIIYTSFIHAVPESLFEHNSQVHAPTEAMIRDSGLEYTFLRHNLYTEFLVADLKQTLASGQLRRGGGSGRISFIGRDDLGVSAARVLAGDGHAGCCYTETGPRAIDYAEAADILSEVFRQPVRHVDVTPEEWFAHSLGMGFPEPLARASASNVRAVSAGEFATESDDYRSITGAPARDVHRYLQDNRERFLAAL